MAEFIPWAAMVMGLASIGAVIYGAWASRQRAATEIEIISSLRNEIDDLVKDNQTLRARMRALENMNGTILTTLEEYHRGSVLNVKQIRNAGMTPLWEPTGMTWRGDDDSKDDE